LFALAELRQGDAGAFGDNGADYFDGDGPHPCPLSNVERGIPGERAAHSQAGAGLIQYFDDLARQKFVVDVTGGQLHGLADDVLRVGDAVARA